MTRVSPKTNGSTSSSTIRLAAQILKDKKIPKQSKMPENIKKHINKKLLYFAINDKHKEAMKIVEGDFDEEHYQPSENYTGDESKYESELDVNYQDEKTGMTALMHACINGKNDLIYALTDTADIDLPDNEGITPLMYAAMNGHDTTPLTENDADIRGQDNTGMTPLMYATLNGHQDVVIQLMEASDFDPKYINMKNKYGQTALDLCSNDKIRKYIMESKLDEDDDKSVSERSTSSRKSVSERSTSSRKSNSERSSSSRKSKDAPVAVETEESEEHYYEFSENKYNLICEDMMEKLKNIPGERLIETDLVNLSLDKDFVFNPQANRPNAMFHVDMVNVYFCLLQKEFPENLYLLTSVLYAYDDENAVDVKPNTSKNPVVIEEEEDGGDFNRFKKFLTGHNKPIEKMLDRMLDMIDDGKNKIFIPIYLNQNHFALMEIDIKTKSFVYHDSLLQKKKDADGFTANAKKYIKLVRNLIIDYYEYKKKTYAGRNELKKWVHTKPINAEQNDDLPQQDNNYDCGIYTCAFGYLLSKKEKIPDKFTKAQMQNIRLRIKQSFVDGIITP
jgi:hypothetical protein